MAAPMATVTGREKTADFMQDLTSRSTPWFRAAALRVFSEVGGRNGR
jgi:hypothetical protein